MLSLTPSNDAKHRCMFDKNERKQKLKFLKHGKICKRNRNIKLEHYRHLSKSSFVIRRAFSGRRSLTSEHCQPLHGNKQPNIELRLGRQKTLCEIRDSRPKRPYVFGEILNN